MNRLFSKYLALLIFGLSHLCNWASVTTDSIYSDSISTTHLSPVIVRESRSSASIDKISYKTNRRERQNATDGFSLLQLMAIPAISVDLLNSSVSMGGANVSFYIDGMPADLNDIADMNTRDVFSIEVLKYPSDPQFRNDTHVINFVMAKYQYGGYTKLNTTEMFLADFASNNILNSKFVNNKITYDARINYQYGNYRHNGNESTEQFKLPIYKQIPSGFLRNEYIDLSKTILHNANYSLRAQYRDNKTKFSSTISFTSQNRPNSHSNGFVSFDPAVNPFRNWHNNCSSDQNVFSWNNSFFRMLSNDWTLTSNINLLYAHGTKNQTLVEGSQTIRQYIAKERIFNINGSIELYKMLSDSHSLTTATSFKINPTKLRYSGLTQYSFHAHQWDIKPSVIYRFQKGDFFSATANIGLKILRKDIQQHIQTNVNPDITLAANFMPSNHHWFSLSLMYKYLSPFGSNTNPVRLKENAYLWSEGNPQLHDFSTLTTRLYYSFSLGDIFTLSPEISYDFYNNFVADSYSCTIDGAAILARPLNCGKFHNCLLRITPTFYALNKKLIVQGEADVEIQKFDGLYNQKHCNFSAKLYASYFFNQFNIGINYTSASSSFTSANPTLRKIRSQFWLKFGWGNSKWTVNAFIINPWRSHWKNSSSMIETAIYSICNQNISISSHRRINLVATFTFGYGKKIYPGADLNAPSEIESAIR